MLQWQRFAMRSNISITSSFRRETPPAAIAVFCLRPFLWRSRLEHRFCVSPKPVGTALPGEFGALFHYLRANAAHAEDVTWSAHCHNDLGLAVANSLAAIENGALQIECTVDGIGERRGNTPMQLVVRALHQRSDAFASFKTSISPEHVSTSGDLLAGVISGAARERAN